MARRAGRTMHDFNSMGNPYPLKHLGRMQSPTSFISTAYLLRQHYPLIMHALPSPQRNPRSCVEAGRKHLGFWGSKRRFCGVVWRDHHARRRHVLHDLHVAVTYGSTICQPAQRLLEMCRGAFADLRSRGVGVDSRALLKGRWWFSMRGACWAVVGWVLSAIDRGKRKSALVYHEGARLCKTPPGTIYMVFRDTGPQLGVSLENAVFVRWAVDEYRKAGRGHVSSKPSHAQTPAPRIALQLSSFLLFKRGLQNIHQHL
ncbi:hypothetical protein BKA58DRAFT_177554 [Alternaria rosae]|uniref:uncharacterized protein n=1 Tax=Alternaria rosae TaxID=1187941 RepID=UPI001E8D3B36|nr:uncharacterized protein BKA58DRAFT_177554 [Alternaria rosae]KAH6870479.1 hypothetical protein BKA58DRAFT_177554 [Alternaria rosae]